MSQVACSAEFFSQQDAIGGLFTVTSVRRLC